MAKPYLKKGKDDKIRNEKGEIIDEKTYHYLVDNEQDFYIVYCRLMSILSEMSECEIKTVSWIAANMQFNKNMIVLTSGVKQQAATDMKVSVSCISNSIPGLVRKGVLYRETGSDGRRDCIYYLSPEYFWKGERGERRKALKLVLELRMDGAATTEEDRLQKKLREDK